MTAVATPPVVANSRFQIDSDSLSTLRDPRSPLDDFPSPTQGSPASSPHPDLNVEVASLSNKLISAINHQTHLDDALAATRQQLDSEQQRVRRLEALCVKHESLLAAGQLVRREDVDRQIDNYSTRLSEEQRQRTTIEREKKGIELELENLTTALFEEANEMVAAARKERGASERRNEQLRTQLKDTEALLASHQEQLAELKSVMAQMNQVKDDMEQATNTSTAPSTPALPSQGEIEKAVEIIHVGATGGHVENHPAPPSSFTHLLSLVLRTDIPAYEDFKSLLEIPRRSAPSSRVNSGSYGGMSISASTSALSASLQQAAQASPHSYVGQFSHYAASSPPYSAPIMSTPLKETKFYKRVLAEDIEPTMRLDTAPGLSWLARRTVINSMCEGSLIVEPMPTSTRTSVFSCSLCGENRKEPDFARTHRFRTSESDSAQRYPLCEYCLNRVRATCDYLGFLRLIKDGHWRTESDEAEKAAWEESVRLRERMFWARIGGGTLPAFMHRDSPRLSADDSKPPTPFSAPATYSQAPQHKIPWRDIDGSSLHEENADYSTSTSHYEQGQQVQDALKLSAPSSNRPSLTIEQSDSHNDGSRIATDDYNRLRARSQSRAESQERQRNATQGRSLTPQNNPYRERSSSPSITTKHTDGSELAISIPGGFT